jgi:hypothetical protein
MEGERGGGGMIQGFDPGCASSVTWPPGHSTQVSADSPAAASDAWRGGEEFMRTQQHLALASICVRGRGSVTSGLVFPTGCAAAEGVIQHGYGCGHTLQLGQHVGATGEYIGT